MNYIVENYMPKATVYTEKAELDAFLAAHSRIMRENSKNHFDFYNKMCQLKQSRGLKSIDEIPMEWFYDMRVSMMMSNQQVYELFGINKNKLAKLSHEHQVFCDSRQMMSALVLGVHLIDVDKFVENFAA